MSLINAMLLDLEHRNHQPSTPVAKRFRSIRLKGLMLIALFIGFAFGGTALNQPAQTPIRSSSNNASVEEFQEPVLSVTPNLDADFYTDQTEPHNIAAPITSLTHRSNPDPNTATVDITVTVSQFSPTANTTTELQPAQSNNLYPIQTAVIPTPQQSTMSVNTTPIADVFTAKRESYTSDAPIPLLPQISESYPRAVKADTTASQPPQIVIKAANFQSAQVPKQTGLEELIYPKLTLSASNETASRNTELQAGENTSHNTTKPDLISSQNRHPHPSVTKTKTKAKAKASKTVAQPPSSINTVESNDTEPNDTESIEVTHRPLSADQLAQRAIRVAANVYKEGNFSEAQRILEDLLAQDNAQHKARLLLAKLYAQQNLNKRAELVLSNGLLHYPQHVPYASLYAQILAKQGHDGAAIDALQNALPGARDNADLHALLAGLYQRTGNSKAASKSYLLALGLEPKHGEWWMGLGISSEQAGDRSTAERAYNEALQYPLTNAVEQYAEQRLQQLVAKKAASKDQINK